MADVNVSILLPFVWGRGMFGGNIVENILESTKMLFFSIAYFSRFISVCRNLELEFSTGREPPFFCTEKDVLDPLLICFKNLLLN